VKRGIRLLLGAMLAAVGPVLAAGPIRLELPTLAGDRFFNLSEVRGQPVLINLWDTACPFCLREMPLLNAFAQAHPEMRVAGIALAPPRQSLDYLETHPAAYLQLAAPADPSALLRRLGDPHGALPYSVLLGPDHAVCAVKTGPLDREWLDAALARCK
jgi:thiol-disulfide isomerase/thioredoxin